MDATKRRNILRLAIVGMAALCCLVTYRIDGNNKLQYEEQYYYLRRLLSTKEEALKTKEEEEDLSIPNWLTTADQDGHPSLEEAMATAIQTSLHAMDQEKQQQGEALPQYTIMDAIQSSSIFKDAYAVLVYDNVPDEFLLLYMGNEEVTSACVKLRTAFDDFVYLLRMTFPERFCGEECDELAIPISSGDFPHLNSHQHDKGCFENFPQASPSCTTDMPILHFGSTFKNFQGLPHHIAMPQPIPSGLTCFRKYIRRNKSVVCNGFSSVTSSQADTYPHLTIEERSLSLFNNEPQVFNDGDDSKKWDELIPQVIWRGSNFQFMSLMQNGLRNPSLVRGDIPTDEIDKIQDVTERREAAAMALGNKYDRYRPRWKGVILTAQAEVEAEANGGLPWANIKLVGEQNKEEGLYEKLIDYGITARGDKMKPEQMADYRYQIDLGGGGGTTWTGTIQKLAMPGLLFHHVTVTKDYIHDLMKPYIHYVPVKADLSDLKEKYDWAEANPKAAKLIADQGTMLMRHIGTLEGFGELFEEFFVEPVRRVMDAYQPVSTTHSDMSWRDVIKQAEGLPDIIVRTKCTADGCTDMEESL